MKNFAIVFVLAVTMLGCRNKIYRVDGFMLDGEGKTHKAVWYMDSYKEKHDTLVYSNTDSTHVIITQPYTVTRIDE